MLVRIGIVVDVAVSCLIIISGVCILVAENWDSRSVFGLVCVLVGLIYIPIKLIILYFIIAPLLGLDARLLLIIGSIFLTPMFGLCLAAFLLLLKQRKNFFESIKAEVMNPVEREILFLVAHRKPDFIELKSTLNLEEDVLKEHLRNLKDLIELDYRKKYKLTNVGKATYMSLNKKGKKLP